VPNWGTNFKGHSFRKFLELTKEMKDKIWCRKRNKDCIQPSTRPIDLEHEQGNKKTKIEHLHGEAEKQVLELKENAHGMWPELVILRREDRNSLGSLVDQPETVQNSQHNSSQNQKIRFR
jgi:hypothetical protein